MALFASLIVCGLFYFSWRPGAMNPQHLWWSQLFLVAEIAAFIWSCIFLSSVIRLPRREPPAARDGRSVDVFVPTYNEPFEVVRRTLMAAVAIDYSHETWLLDDGHRDEMRTLAAQLGCRYLARGSNSDAKAGNLNHALTFARGDFVALFDADHVADARFLHRTLGYFDDVRVAFVQTPQEFFNFDSYQHFDGAFANGTHHEQSLFFRVILRSRDASNSAMFCGSSAVLRRRAIDDAGGFATGTVTEDMHTSVRLHANGWRSVYHPETLSAGIAPYEPDGFRRQRLRWSQGAHQVGYQERLLTRPGLSASQRWYYILHVLNHAEGWRHACFFLLPAIVLITGISPLTANGTDYILHFAPYFLASVLAFEELGRGHGRFIECEVFNLARCTISMRAAFASWRRRVPFRVTSKTRGQRSDRFGAAFPWFVFAASLAAIAIALLRAATGTNTFPVDSLAIVIAWALFNVCIVARLELRSRRSRRNRRAATRLPCALPAVLHGEDSVARQVDVAAASADGITLRTADPCPAGRYHCEFHLDGRAFSFCVTLRTAGAGTNGGAIVWAAESERAEFDLALHRTYIRRLALINNGDTQSVLASLPALWRRVPATAVARTLAVCLGILSAVLATTNVARANDALILTGADVSATSSYLSAGAIVSLDGSLASNGALLRLWADRLTYTFETGGVRVGALSWGQSVSAGYQVHDPGGFESAYVGVDDRTTALAPAAASPTLGTRIGARYEFDADRKLGAGFHAFAIGTLVSATHDYWTRLQLLSGAGGGVGFGPEAVVQGNPDYHGTRLGLALANLSLGGIVHASLDSGLQRFNGADNVYGGISLGAQL
jgi:cellulose synthase/poly-beta-1,6-N-acetylglucosamine synthase-like glycosyltransferase